MNTTTRSDELLDRLDAAIAVLEQLLAGIRSDLRGRIYVYFAAGPGSSSDP